MVFREVTANNVQAKCTHTQYSSKVEPVLFADETNSDTSFYLPFSRLEANRRIHARKKTATTKYKKFSKRNIASEQTTSVQTFNGSECASALIQKIVLLWRIQSFATYCMCFSQKQIKLSVDCSLTFLSQKFMALNIFLGRLAGISKKKL